MTSIDKPQFMIPAWAISLTLHGVAIGLAFAFSTQITPLVQEDRFTWDVALVQRVSPASKSELVESTATSASPPVKKLFPSRPKPVADTSRPVTSIEQNNETPLPRIKQMAEVPQVREEPAEQGVVDADISKIEPVVETKASETVAVAALPESVDPQPVHQEPGAIESAPLSTSDVSISREGTATAVAALGSEAKTDNRWLAESLWRRVAELKRYPSSARLNGQEGKVILRAIIRSDGQLADVVVQKSSGYSTLDEAAIEAVRLACPLHMKQALGKPLIVVSLPIVYSLAN